MTDPFDPRLFRKALGAFPTGVALVTTLSQANQPVGLTISSFNSVSIDPPLVLWSLLLTSPSLPDFEAATHFAINVLSEEQAAISNQFAARRPDKFSGVKISWGLGGVPLIADAAAVFECTPWRHYDGGDHRIILGKVARFRHWQRKPLVFASGRYDRLANDAMAPSADELWPIAVG